MTPRAVIFDWGGVIKRTGDASMRHLWDRRLRLPPGSVEQAVHGSKSWRQAQKGKISTEEYWLEVSNLLNLQPGQIPDLRYDYYRGDYLDHTLIDLIRSLRNRNVLTGLLSNYTSDLALEIEALHIDHCFDCVVISADIGVMKPEPAAYATILDKLDVTPNNSIFIDDFIENVIAARNIGMEAVHFTEGINLRPLLRAWLSNETTLRQE